MGRLKVIFKLFLAQLQNSRFEEDLLLADYEKRPLKDVTPFNIFFIRY